jgi:hypothetical protein
MLFSSFLAAAQNRAVDQMFEKYSEREGFSVISISGKMFSMFAQLDSENDNADDIIRNLKSIKILTVNDSLLNKGINFYSELFKKLDPDKYEELMVVKEAQDVTKFLVSYSGDRIAELLVITGGPGGNSLISIQGNFSLKNLSELSGSIDIDGLEKLEKADKKKP